MIRIIIGLLLSIFLLATGAFFGYQWKAWSDREHVNIDATVLLEQIREVNKVVRIEADFSEVMRHKSWYYFDFSPFRKQSIMHVQATVMAGFDMENARIDLDHENKIAVLSGVKSPAILSVQPQIKYFDLQQGSFNYYSADDLSELQKHAVSVIHTKALTSGILGRVREKGPLFQTITDAITQQDGWTLMWVEEHHPTSA